MKQAHEKEHVEEQSGCCKVVTGGVEAQRCQGWFQEFDGQRQF